MARKYTSGSRRGARSAKRVQRSGFRKSGRFSKGRKGSRRSVRSSSNTGRPQTVRIVVEHRQPGVQPVGVAVKPAPAPKKPQF